MAAEEIFKNLSFVFDWKITASINEKAHLRQLVMERGGDVTYSVTKQTSYLVIAGDDHVPEVYKSEQAGNYSIPVITGDFILDSIQCSTLQDVQPYIKQNEITEKKNCDEKQDVSDQEKDFSPMESVRTWEYGAEGSPKFNESKYEVLKFCFLKKPCSSGVKDNALFYVLELHASDDFNQDHRFRVYSNFDDQQDSLVDGKRQLTSCQYFTTAAEAGMAYAKVHNKLTTSPSRFVEQMKIPENTTYGSPKFQKVIQLEYSGSMDKYLIGDLWKETWLYITDHVNTDSRTFTLEMVDKALGILELIKEELYKGGNKEDVEWLSESFYQALPHKTRDLPVVNNIDILIQKVYFCQMIKRVLSLSESASKNHEPFDVCQTLKLELLSVERKTLGDNTCKFQAVEAAFQSKMDSGINLRFDQFKNMYAVQNVQDKRDRVLNTGSSECTFYPVNPQNIINILCSNISEQALLTGLCSERSTEKQDTETSFSEGCWESGTIRKSHFLFVCEVPYNSLESTPADGVSAPWGEKEGNSDLKHRNVYLLEVHPLETIAKTVVMQGALKQSRNLCEMVDISDQVFLYTNYCKTIGPLPGNKLDIIYHKTAMVEPHRESWRVETSSGGENSNVNIARKVGLMKGGENSIFLPVSSINVKAKVMDMVAEVNLTQTFVNNSNVTIDTEYHFPLDDKSAVVGFEAVINDRRVCGKIQEKKVAHQTYNEAVAEGQGACLLEQRPSDKNSFIMKVGNIGPQDTVVVMVTYICELQLVDHKVCFQLPTLDTDEKQTPPGSKQFCECAAQVAIEMPFDITTLECPTHDVKMERTATKADVLLNKNQRLIKGLQILIGFDEIHLPRMWVERHSDYPWHQACMLTFYPELHLEEDKAMEVIFLVDVSRSMKGKPLSDIQDLLLTCLESLPYRFNIMTFGQELCELFPCCKKLSPQIKVMAESFVKKLEASAGFTELSGPLRTINTLSSTSVNTAIFILTDGHVNAQTVAMETANQCGDNIQIYTLAVGQNVNCHFLSTLAREGGGLYEQFDTKDKHMWSEKVSNLMRKAGSPCVNHLSLNWEQFESELPPREQSPALLPTLYSGSRCVIYGFVQNCTMAYLHGRFNGEEVSTVVSTPELCVTEGTVLHSLTAQALISDWQQGILNTDPIIHQALKFSKTERILELSKEFNVLCPMTSFVAVEEKHTTDTIKDDNDKSERRIADPSDKVKPVIYGRPKVTSQAGNKEPPHDMLGNRSSETYRSPFGSKSAKLLGGALGGKVIGNKLGHMSGNVFGGKSTLHTGNVFGSKPTLHTGNVFGSKQALSSGNVFGSKQALPTGHVFGSKQALPTGHVFGSKQALLSGNAFGSKQALPSSNAFCSKQALPSSNVFGSKQALPSVNVFGSKQALPSSNVLGSKLALPTDHVFGSKQALLSGNAFGSKQALPYGSVFSSKQPCVQSLIGNSSVQFAQNTSGSNVVQSDNSLFGNKMIQSSDKQFGSTLSQPSQSVFGSKSIGASQSFQKVTSNVPQQLQSLFGSPTVQPSQGLVSSTTNTNQGSFGNSTAQTSPDVFGNSTVNTNQGLFGPSSTQTNQGLFGPSSTQINQGLFGNSTGHQTQGRFSSLTTEPNNSLFGSSAEQPDKVVFSSSTSQPTRAFFGHSTVQPNHSRLGSSKAYPDETLSGSSALRHARSPSSDTAAEPQQNLFCTTAQPPTSLFSKAEQPSQNVFGNKTEQPSQNVFGNKTEQPSQNVFGNKAEQPSQNVFGSKAEQPSQKAFGIQAEQPSQKVFGNKAEQQSQNVFGIIAEQPSQSVIDNKTQNVFGKSGQIVFGKNPEQSSQNVFGNKPERQSQSVFVQNDEQPSPKLIGSNSEQASLKAFGNNAEQPCQSELDNKAEQSSLNVIGSKSEQLSQSVVDKPEQQTQNVFGKNAEQSAQIVFGKNREQTSQNVFGNRPEQQSQTVFVQTAEQPSQNAFGSNSEQPPQNAFGNNKLEQPSQYGFDQTAEQPSQILLGGYSEQPSQNTEKSLMFGTNVHANNTGSSFGFGANVNASNAGQGFGFGSDVNANTGQGFGFGTNANANKFEHGFEFGCNINANNIGQSFGTTGNANTPGQGFRFGTNVNASNTGQCFGFGTNINANNVWQGLGFGSNVNAYNTGRGFGTTGNANTPGQGFGFGTTVNANTAGQSFGFDRHINASNTGQGFGFGANVIPNNIGQSFGFGSNVNANNTGQGFGFDTSVQPGRQGFRFGNIAQQSVYNSGQGLRFGNSVQGNYTGQQFPFGESGQSFGFGSNVNARNTGPGFGTTVNANTAGQSLGFDRHINASNTGQGFGFGTNVNTNNAGQDFGFGSNVNDSVNGQGFGFGTNNIANNTGQAIRFGRNVNASGAVQGFGIGTSVQQPWAVPLPCSNSGQGLGFGNYTQGNYIGQQFPIGNNAEESGFDPTLGGSSCNLPYNKSQKPVKPSAVPLATVEKTLQKCQQKSSKADSDLKSSHQVLHQAKTFVSQIEKLMGNSKRGMGRALQDLVQEEWDFVKLMEYINIFGAMLFSASECTGFRGVQNDLTCLAEAVEKTKTLLKAKHNVDSEGRQLESLREYICHKWSLKETSRLLDVLDDIGDLIDTSAWPPESKAYSELAKGRQTLVRCGDPVLSLDNIEDIFKLQHEDGHWELSKNLDSLLGVDKELCIGLLNEAGLKSLGKSIGENVLAVLATMMILLMMLECFTTTTFPMSKSDFKVDISLGAIVKKVNWALQGHEKGRKFADSILKAGEFIKKIDKEHILLYSQLELGGSWEEAAGNMLKLIC